MNNQKNTADLSYFRLALLSFLRESHPHLASDEKFITARTETALDTYEQAIRNGQNPLEAEHSASEILFNGLYFSKHDTLKNILWNEFSAEIPENKAKALAIKLLPHCEIIFSNYSLSDDFVYLPEYELLYTELTGEICLLLENPNSQLVTNS